MSIHTSVMSGPRSGWVSWPPFRIAGLWASRPHTNLFIGRKQDAVQRGNFGFLSLLLIRGKESFSETPRKISPEWFHSPLVSCTPLRQRPWLELPSQGQSSPPSSWTKFSVRYVRVCERTCVCGVGAMGGGWREKCGMGMPLVIQWTVPASGDLR